MCMFKVTQEVADGFLSNFQSSGSIHFSLREIIRFWALHTKRKGPMMVTFLPSSHTIWPRVAKFSMCNTRLVGRRPQTKEAGPMGLTGFANICTYKWQQRSFAGGDCDNHLFPSATAECMCYNKCDLVVTFTNSMVNFMFVLQLMHQLQLARLINLQ